jgi:microcystin-dependent protein
MPTKPGYVWSGTEWINIGQEAAVSPFKYQTTEPPLPATGDIWIDSDDQQIKVYTGTAWVNLILANASPPGIVSPFAGSEAPFGYLLCDGSAVSRTTYSGLFTAISTAYGVGNGSTTFNLPDLRGRTIAGLDNIGGTDAGRLSLANTLGTTAGTQTHTLTSAEMPSHTHTQNAHGHTLGGGQSFGMSFGPNAGGFATFGIALAFVNSSTYQGPYAAMDTTATNQNTGGGGAHNNMQPTMLLNYIIKT